MDIAFINAKGFGGNNATASLLAPHVVDQMLRRKHGARVVDAAKVRNQLVAEKASEYDASATRGESMPIYKFDHGVLDADDVQLSQEELKLAGFSRSIDLNIKSPYADMLS